MNNKNYSEDIETIKFLLNLSNEQLAKELNVSRMTIDRWMKSKNKPSSSEMENIYSFAYRNDIDINLIKIQSIKKEYDNILFHSSRRTITSNINLKHNSKNNDFENGFHTMDPEKVTTHILGDYETNKKIKTHEN